MYLNICNEDYMDIAAIKEKMTLRKNFLLEKREAQKLRKPDDFLMTIEINIRKLDSELIELSNSN